MANLTRDTSKEIKYLGKDFDSLKKGLIEFAKIYYPNTYNDFNEASPGMMFVEMAAYVGDVLNYYIDSQFKESMILHATERRSVLSIAAAMGYKPKLSVPSVVDLEIYQLFPASGSGNGVGPDMRYALKIEAGMLARTPSTTNINNDLRPPIEFRVANPIDFSINNVFDPTEFSVYSIDNSGAPNYFLAKKMVKAISATPRTRTYTIDTATRFLKLSLQDTDLIGIESIVDADGNTWYEVPYLAQDTIFEKVENTALNDPDAAVYGSETPYLLKLKRVPRRFITRVVEGGLEIQFGSGISSAADEELLATPENIGISLPTGIDHIDAPIDPTSPLITTAYGVAPSETVLTVNYLVGGGIKSNVASNTITEITSININNSILPTENTTLTTTIRNSIAVVNPVAAAGGRSEESLEEMRQNALQQLSSQNRAVTKEDYIIRAYAMPNVYGSVAKVYIAPDEQNNIQSSEVGDVVANPLALNMYMLGYDNDKKLVNVNRAVKENLKTYLSQYRMLTDSINFRDAFIINIGVEFDLIVLPAFNTNEVLLGCIDALKKLFDIDYWQINQPIVYSDIYNALLRVRGVQTIPGIRVTNINDETNGYSNVIYNIQAATRRGVVYPSLDPSIFEVKFPNNDIKGRIVTY